MYLHNCPDWLLHTFLFFLCAGGIFKQDSLSINDKVTSISTGFITGSKKHAGLRAGIGHVAHCLSC